MINLNRPSRIEIDLEALKHNITTVKSRLRPGGKFMAVVKADAYGHGSERVSRVAEECAVDYLGVAFLEEANELKESGIKTPIAILYPETAERNLEAARRGFHISVSSPDDIRKIREITGNNGTPLRYFVTLNTGMNRYGMDPDPGIVERMMGSKITENGLVGFNTNIADPLMSKEDLSKKQEDRFLDFMREMSKFTRNGTMFSYEASGSIWAKQSTLGTLARVGLLLYGIAPDDREYLPLKPVMSVRSRIAEIHRLSPGEGVGYGFSFVADRESRVAVIPVGYADGYSWNLSNRGAVIVNGTLAPIVGRVCMDAFMVDVTDIESANSGGEVVLLGRQGKCVIDANQMADWAGTLSYEILAGWSKRMPRIYI